MSGSRRIAVLATLTILMLLAQGPKPAESSSSNAPTMAMLVDAPQTAVEGTTIVIHVRFFNIEPSEVAIREFAYNGFYQSPYPEVRHVVGDGGTLDIKIGSYRRETFSVKIPTFSDRYPDEKFWPIRWSFYCMYYSPIYGHEMGFVSSSTTIVTRAEGEEEPEINENGLIIQTTTITLAPGETGNAAMTVMNLLPVTLNCALSVYAFQTDTKSGSLYLDPFESEQTYVEIKVPESTDPGTYSYLAGVNAHHSDAILPSRSFTAFASGAVIVEERETSGDLGFDCIIATAAYGSPLSPTVRMMRSLRDTKIGSTFTGKNFVSIFNSWYYSWSPGVADMVEKTELRREAARILLTPLVIATMASDRVFDALSWNIEIASLASLQCSAFLCGLFYVSWPILLVKKYTTPRSGLRNGIRLAATVYVPSLLMITAGQLVQNQLLNGVGIVTLSLASTCLGALLMLQAIKKIHRVVTNSFRQMPEWVHIK